MKTISDYAQTWAKYEPVELISVSRKVDPPIRIRGKEVHRYNAPLLIVRDRRTGEDFRVAGWHFSEKFLKCEAVLRSLRAQPRHFAHFLLMFRNSRRGTTPGVDELVRWYADLYDLRADNVRRYLTPLRKAGVIESETLLGPLFQRSDSDMFPDEFLGEGCQAGSKFARMWWQRESLMQERAEYVGAEEPLLQKLAA